MIGDIWSPVSSFGPPLIVGARPWQGDWPARLTKISRVWTDRHASARSNWTIFLMMKSDRALKGLAALAAVVVGGFILTERFGTSAAHALRPGDTALLALGNRVYVERCAACHGAQLEGQPDWRSRSPDGLLPAPPHDASGHTWHHPDELLFRITKFGLARTLDMPDYKTTMPAYEGVLKDEEIVAVLSWIKSRWPASMREKHDRLNAQSREGG